MGHITTEAGKLGSGSTGGFPPTFTIASPRSTEGEAMAKAGGKEIIHVHKICVTEISVRSADLPTARKMLCAAAVVSWLV